MHKTDYNFKAPALPYPPKEYDFGTFQQLNNVLRIYFNQLDRSLSLALSDGAYAAFSRTTDVTAALADTEYTIEYDDPTYISGISKGTPASRIVFEEGGQFLVSFTAQIYSTNASTVNFYFWPKINGADADSGSAIKSSLKANGDTMLVSRTSIFPIFAGDYLEVAWAVSSTDGSLDAASATAFSPATPSTTLSITRIAR
tara:strand:+ start:3403 stop:4002 length:600 start_codon:yes stop_codon:yes gene_type:complete